MTFSDAVCDYLLHIKVERGLSKTTYHTYQAWLHHFQEWMGENDHPDDLSTFTTPVLRRYLYDIAKKNYRPRTIRAVFHPIRGIGVFLVEAGYLTENPAGALEMPKKDASVRPLVSREEVLALIAACDRIHDARKSALYRACLSSLVYCGLRSGELLDLKVGDYMDGKLVVASGKGAKRCELFPPVECREALRAWLAVRRRDCRYGLMWAQDWGRGMGRASLAKMLDELKAVAGLEVHGNRQRHFFTTHLMRRGRVSRRFTVTRDHRPPFHRGRFADRVLVAAKPNFLNRPGQGPGIKPVHRHEVLAPLRVIAT